MPTVVEHEACLAESMHVVDAIAQSDVGQDQDDEEKGQGGEHSVRLPVVSARWLNRCRRRVRPCFVDMFHGAKS
jgi:hypothetical protein